MKKIVLGLIAFMICIAFTTSCTKMCTCTEYGENGSVSIEEFELPESYQDCSEMNNYQEWVNLGTICE